MKLFAWRFIALSSALLLGVGAATRPRYGGTLRVQVIEMSALESTADTLVRIDEHGEVQPGLAISWQHDVSSKRWRFNLRPKVSMHDGTPVNPVAVAKSLGAALRLQAAASGQQIIVQSSEPAFDLLARLAMPSAAIAGTGPFRMLQIEPGRGAVVTAFEEYWGGRP